MKRFRHRPMRARFAILAIDKSPCLAHCSQADQTNDVARVPVIPALPAALLLIDPLATAGYLMVLAA